MWEQVKVLDTSESILMFKSFNDYMEVPVFGRPLGHVKPTA